MAYEDDDEIDKLDPEDQDDEQSPLVKNDETMSGLGPQDAIAALPENDQTKNERQEREEEAERKSNKLDEEEIEKEVDASQPEESVEEAPDRAPSSEQEELIKQLTDLTGKNKPPSKLDQYHNFIQQYQQLQNQRRNMDLVAGLAAAGGKIGQSIAGRYSGQFNPDMTGYNVLQQMANRPVTDFEQGQVVQSRQMQLQQELAANDPASPQSKLIRDYLNNKILKPAGMQPVGDDVSAADAASILKTVGKPQTTHLSQLPMVNQQTGAKTMAIFNPTLGTFTDASGQPLGAGWVRDYRAQSFVDPATQERMSFSGGTGKVAGALTGPGVNRPGVPEETPEGKPIELTRTMLTAQQQKQLDHTRDKFVGEVKDDRNAINSADRVINVLDKGDELNGDILGELRDQMSRAFGQKGHITDAQMGRILGREDWKSKFNNAISVATTGKLDDENRQFLRQVMQAIRDQNQLFVTNKAKVYSANLSSDFGSAPNLTKAHVTPDAINKLLNVQAAAASSATQPNNMVMVTSIKSGKQFMLPKDKVQEALDKKLIQPIGQ